MCYDAKNALEQPGTCLNAKVGSELGGRSQIPKAETTRQRGPTQSSSNVLESGCGVADGDRHVVREVARGPELELVYVVKAERLPSDADL